jgi:CubicO group peptidase (beta-lactamase class C family)
MEGVPKMRIPTTIAFTCLLTFLLFSTASAQSVQALGQDSVSVQLHRGPLRDFQTETSTKTLATHHVLNKSYNDGSLDSFFVSLISTNHIPGLAACIVKKDSIVWQGYYGYADISKNKPVTDSTIFMLASVSKTITGTALMQLYEQGKFKLDDSVNAYLPFQVRNPKFPDTPITFRMLMLHASSIQDNWNAMPYYTGDPKMGLDRYLREYLTPGGQYYSPSSNFYSYAPGITWNYSNIGVALAGYLVEVISGVPFDKYCTDHIFSPLRMTRTAWFLKDLDTILIARPYAYSSGRYSDYGLYGYSDYPDGQLRTTVTSLAKFLVANMNWGNLKGMRLLDSSTVRLMRTVYIPIVSGYEDQQGLIWYKELWSGHGLWGHTGGDNGVTTQMWISENDTTGVISLANTNLSISNMQMIVNRLIDESHTFIVGVNDPTADIPKQFQLMQNYPNPFNPSTTISYSLPKSATVTIKIFNALGQEVALLENERKDAGNYQTTWNAFSTPSGVYFYRLQAGEYLETKKMILVK